MRKALNWPDKKMVSFANPVRNEAFARVVRKIHVKVLDGSDSARLAGDTCVDGDGLLAPNAIAPGEAN
jgi:hypothetical protein